MKEDTGKKVMKEIFLISDHYLVSVSTALCATALIRHSGNPSYLSIAHSI